jgi:hypothetical protein
MCSSLAKSNSNRNIGPHTTVGTRHSIVTDPTTLGHNSNSQATEDSARVYKLQLNNIQSTAPNSTEVDSMA